VPPDLSDPYGLRYEHDYEDWQGRICRFEIYKRAFEGESEEVDAAGGNVNFSFENEGKVFTPFRGSRASVTLKSSVSKKFHDIFEGDERDHYGRFLVDGVVKWTGWITPDIFSERLGNPPYLTNLNFNDGIGGLKDLPFPDVNDNGFTGTISEKDAVIACLGRIGLRLDVHIACNIREESMDTGSAPIEQSFVNVEAFVKLSQGESQPLNCYEVLTKILTSWNAELLQEENKWWIVREPELYEDLLVYKRFDADGVALGTATRTLDRTFAGEGIKLHGPNSIIEVYADRHCQPNTGWLLQMDTWTLHSTGGVPMLLEEDGQSILREATDDAYEGRWGAYYQMYCNAPGYNVRIGNL
jgi:hypothetical protein